MPNVLDHKKTITFTVVLELDKEATPTPDELEIIRATIWEGVDRQLGNNGLTPDDSDFSVVRIRVL